MNSQLPNVLAIESPSNRRSLKISVRQFAVFSVYFHRGFWLISTHCNFVYPHKVELYNWSAAVYTTTFMTQFQSYITYIFGLSCISVSYVPAFSSITLFSLVAFFQYCTMQKIITEFLLQLSTDTILQQVLLQFQACWNIYTPQPFVVTILFSYPVKLFLLHFESPKYSY